ncbi:MAG: FAD-dependent monooxygenase, partial [Prolixibacteraceae bacterium]|nr:FAD-dependent monooxygenase [Prolixibacteraceae bacterium]
MVRRSVDARGRNVRINLGVEVFVGELPDKSDLPGINYANVENKPEVVIVGAGPAGLFAALRLIELGLKPVIVERGKDVSLRKADIAAIHRNEMVNPDSNYGFGEGGAGTFSDGKLYTRSKKKGDIRKILQVLHQHGAQSEILIDAHPHIGTN